MDLTYLQGKASREIAESLARRGINSFTPPQELALKNGLLEGENIVVASPTASGKTLIAEIAAINTILSKGTKAIYVAPMRALVSEKFEEFKKSYPYIKSAISIGDLDSNDPWLAEFELIFMSTEKFDSLIRHGINWLDSIGCIIFDEVHMIGDASRGPTLELLITKLKDTTRSQIVALSATIGNAEEIAEWLSAKLVKSDYRPVPLKKGVVSGKRVFYIYEGGQAEEELNSNEELPELMVVEDTLHIKKQVLIFYATKRNAESGATRISTLVSGKLTEEEKKKLAELSEAVMNVLQRPTEQCKKLATLVAKGVAFHHAGLLNEQRWLIEEAFRRGLIKVICSTTTLALGINTPAHTVLVKDTSRYSNGYGSERLGVNEVLQLFGRAGRPSYDKEGRALLIAKSKENARELAERYIEAKPEPVDSSLGMAPIMRMHVLAFIAEDFLNSETALEEFMLKTFYGYQYGSSRHIREVVREVLQDLEDWNFIEARSSKFFATRIGKRVSELYIDPLSARWMIEALGRKQDLLGLLYMLANTLEMRPYVRATEEAESMYVHYRHMHKAIEQDYEESELGYYDPVGAFSTALMLYDWINEAREDEIIMKYSTTPGALYSKLSIADWIAYSASELARLVKASVREITDVRVRIKYGIKEELLDLVRLQQIGRVRARMLYNNGIKSVAELKENREKVEKILGKEVTQKVFEQFI
ncbi:MAG: DEAD/DEAH box helicase [Candidatus Micrarchaeia archaeon]